MVCLVLVASNASQGARPHSNPPFWTTLPDGLGTHDEVVWGPDEEVSGDVSEEVEVDMGEAAWEDTVVMADEVGVAGVDEEEYEDRVDVDEDIREDTAVVIDVDGEDEEGMDAEDISEVAGDVELKV